MTDIKDTPAGCIKAAEIIFATYDASVADMAEIIAAHSGAREALAYLKLTEFGAANKKRTWCGECGGNSYDGHNENCAHDVAMAKLEGKVPAHDAPQSETKKGE